MEPKFKVGDEVRCNGGGVAEVMEVHHVSGNYIGYVVKGERLSGYYAEDTLIPSEYEFKIGDAVLIKGTLQRAVVVGRKMFTSGGREYTVEFQNGEEEPFYADQLTKDVWPPETASEIKVRDRVTRSGHTVAGTVTAKDEDGTFVVVMWEDGKITAENPNHLRIKPRRVAAEVPGAPEVLREGDRVRLRTGHRGGTVKRRNTRDGSYVVVWGEKHPTTVEVRSQLVVLYAPRPETEVWHPLQAAVDALDAERAELVKEVETVQAKLTATKKAKGTLLDMIRESAVVS